MKPTLPIWSGRLRPLRSDDFEDVLALLHQPEVRRFLCDDEILPAEDVRALIDENLSRDDDGLGLWVIEATSWRFAGIIGLAPAGSAVAAAPEMAGGVEPTIALAPAFQGRGLALEAMIAVIDHFRSTHPTVDLVATVDAPNVRSHRLMHAAGFQSFGTMDGLVHALVLYRHICGQKDDVENLPQKAV